MKPISIHVTQLKPGSNFVQLGIPLAKGSVTDCDTIGIYLLDDRIEAVISPTAYWADGSVKWCVTKISLATSTGLDAELEMKMVNSPMATTNGLTVLDSPDSTTIKSGNVEYHFAKDGKSVFPTVIVGDQTIWNGADLRSVLTNIEDHNCDLTIEHSEIERHDNLTCTYIVRGSFTDNENLSLNTAFRFEILPGGQLHLHCDLHNPQRAAHPGGYWDLGDPGSIEFKDFTLALAKQNDSSTKLKLTTDSPWQDADASLSLVQASSGGNNWNSPTHVNAANKVSNKYCGFKLIAGEKTIQEGLRATPTFCVGEKDRTAYTVHLKNFWQNFPKSIDFESDTANLRLFPHHHGEAYELQGGERKTHEINFQFISADALEDINNSTPIARISPSIYTEAEVFRYFDDQLSHQPYDNLLTHCMDENTGFYAKREQLDEYGWRNFGEIYADHEADLYTGEEIFVSHYNNQYDPVSSFAMQFARTGDQQWYELMSDLALHVMDIDIYRTEQDRVEYNNGLFWHTDHYAPANTATHRTWSSTQLNELGNQTSGGGPGPQHCYSSGFVHYYYLTGNEDSKKTVFMIGDWIKANHDGTGSVLETAKKTLSKDAKNFINTCKGTNVFRYAYPMDRGTGNYLRSLMDCFELSPDKSYIQQLEGIIKNTASPSDDIDARGLEDVEGQWYYVIFLQELIRYLDLKRDLNQFDEAFDYGRATLLHYARWMIENEQPYLNNPDGLTHPNATWVAQEPRKIQIFYAAYKYSLKNRTPFLEKAKFFRDYVTSELSKADTLHYARIQILLLQNSGALTLLDTDSLPYAGLSEKNAIKHENCFHTPATQLKAIAGTWASSLSKFKLSNEIRWVKSRIS